VQAVGIIGIIIAIVGIGIRLYIHSSRKREERIRQFVDNFQRLYKGTGRKLEVLIPAGINNLKNDGEIKEALERVANITSGHPLRKWKDRVERIGYKKFFSYVMESGKELNADTIEGLLKNLENGGSY